jgi:RNA polymerase primary sigma factor
MPLHIVERLNQITRSARGLELALGRAPTKQEIGRDIDLAPEEVARIQRLACTQSSLDKPIGDADGTEFGHFLVDDSEPSPDEVVGVVVRNEACGGCCRCCRRETGA